MRGVRLSREELQQRFPLSNRLTARVGALLAKHVDVSAAVLELATPGSAVERLLALPALLTHAGALTTRRLSAMAGKLDPPIETALAVQAEGGWRTILLEEELLAEQGWQEAKPSAAQLPARPAPGALPARPAPPTALFTPEEIERIKMDALTAADPAQKAASLRRLSMAPVPEQEKASVFFRVLVDPVAQGRAEAILGLQAMGFDPDAADALRDLIEGKEQTRALAVERITGLLGRLGEAHAVIVLGVILEMLRETDSAALQHNLLLALHEAVPLLARREDYAQDTIRLGIKGVQLHHARLAPPVRNVLAGLGRSDPERTVRTLWQELDRVRNHRARVFLLSVLEQIGPPARLRKELAAAMAAEIVNPGAPEAERLLLAHNLASLGEAAVPPLLEALESREVEQKPFLIPFFDILCAEKNISASAKNHVARALLSHLKAGDRRMRIAIVQSWLCCSPDVEAPLRRGFAAELIQNLDEFDHPDVRERIEVNLDRIGEAAVDPLFDFVKQHPLGTHRDPRKNFTDHLVRILATILARAAVQTKTAHARTPAVLEFCIEQIKNDQVRFGGYAVAAATLCAPEAMGPERGTALVALLKERLPAVAYPADVLTGLGVVASADQIALRQKIEVAHIYLRLVAAQRRAPVAQARQTADGVVYEFGKDSELDSVMLPAAVVGAGMVCTSESTSPALRQMVIEQLLAAWREATSWKVTWGPLSAEKLASTLGMLGAHLRTPVELKLEIAHTLKDQAAERLSVVRAMGEICSQPADLKELNEVGLEVADAIMQGWLDIEIEPEERRVVLTTLARIAARNELDRRSPRVKRFRERVLNLVFDAFRERLDGARTLLEILSKCQSLAKNQQREIEERLRTFYAVAKAP